MRTLRIVLIGSMAMACGDKEESSEPATEPSDSEDLSWYMTCGDPVCQGYTGPFDGVPLCDDEQVGDPCFGEDFCDPVDECNALLQCTDEDPAIDCPSSRAEHKKNIEYLSESDRNDLEKKLLELPIAQWNYNWDKPEVAPRTGFIIDGNGGLPAVRPNGEQVDLYGYTTMAIILLQQQAKTIEALERKIEALEGKLK